MQKKPIELLAPAGNMESLKAAVAAGCNAVYLGGTLFSARAFAGNFSHDELIEALAYCHIRGVRVYVTMNTLLFEEELPKAFEEAKFLYEHGVDALLIQDLGLFDYIHQTMPDFELHCSTQMHLHNLDGIRFMRDHGAKRAVLARETPIELVQQACLEGIEIEVFAYGALCISYSGQCLMSQSVKNRSGNRGMCAQCCRLRYQPVVDGDAINDPDGEYLLSPKDLSTLDHLPQLLDAGISSLKIEGRMKRPEYVYAVTRTFREAMDAWQEEKPWHLSEERRRALLLMFNRGFTDGHLFHASTDDRMSTYRPNHQGINIGKVLRFEHGRVLVRLTAPLYQHDGLRILNEPFDTGLTAVRIEKNGLLVNQASAGDDVWLDCHSKPQPKPNQPLQKTTDSKLLEQIDSDIDHIPRLVPVTLSYQAEAGSPLQLTVKDLDGHCVSAVSRISCEQARSAPLDQAKIETNLSKTGDQPYDISFGSHELGDIFLPVSVINETRRDLLEALSKVRAEGPNRNVQQPFVAGTINPPDGIHPLLIVDNDDPGRSRSPEDLNVSETVTSHGIRPLYPTVDETDEGNEVISDAVISQPGSLYHPLNHVIAGMTLNCANSYAMAFLLKQKGIDGIILSSELSDDEIKRSLDAFDTRYGFVPHCWKLVYGRRRLMYIKNGIKLPEHTEALQDQNGDQFPLSQNGAVLELFENQPERRDNPYCFSSYVILHDETDEEASNILEEAYEEVCKRV
ncbi:MAG: U32 family peptidase [Solobacterium sp.]|jgi:putative protease|nr:U32 family peptidase [Solobacterium sp.]